MPSRDSVVWWLLMIGAGLAYLSQMPEPTTWTWAQWMQTLAALVGIVAGKLATSPLKGDKDQAGTGAGGVPPSMRLLMAVLVTGALLANVGCGGTTRSQVRTSAMVASEAVIAIDQAEIDAFAAGAYSSETHRKAGAVMLRLLRADRAYLRAARALPATPPSSALEALAIAKAEVVAASEDLVQLLRDIPAAAKVMAAVRAYAASLGLALSVAQAWPVGDQQPMQAGIALSQALLLLLKMLNDGRISVGKIQMWLAKEGASDEEMAAMDAALTARIEAREAAGER